MRVAIYCRTSETGPEARASLAHQAESAEAFADAQGWETVAIFTDSATARAGIGEDHKELGHLVAGAMAGNFDRVIVAKLDRLSQFSDDCARYVEMLEAAGVGLVSVAEAFDTATPSGRLVRTLLVAFAELERETIAERLANGKLPRNTETLEAEYGMTPDPDPDTTVAERLAAIAAAAVAELLSVEGRCTRRSGRLMVRYCGKALPEGSRLDRVFCSATCRAAEHARHIRDRNRAAREVEAERRRKAEAESHRRDLDGSP